MSIANIDLLSTLAGGFLCFAGCVFLRGILELVELDKNFRLSLGFSIN